MGVGVAWQAPAQPQPKRLLLLLRLGLSKSLTRTHAQALTQLEPLQSSGARAPAQAHA